MAVDEGQHRLDALTVPQGPAFLRSMRDRLPVIQQQRHQFRKRGPHGQFKMRPLPGAGLPRTFDHFQRRTPGRIAARKIKIGLIRGMHQRQQVRLIEHAVEAAAHQPRVEHQGMKAAGAFSCRAGRMQHAGVDKKAVPRMQRAGLAADGHRHAAFGDHRGFQFLVPVPDHLAPAQIVMVAPDRERAGSVSQQFPVGTVHGGVAWRQHRTSPFRLAENVIENS